MKRQLAALFLCNLIMFTNGNALMALLPVYAGRLGADPSLIGYFLSVLFLMIVISATMAGKLSDRLGHRKLLLVISAAGTVPSLFAMGFVTNMWQLTLASMLLWFFAGISTTMVNILVGLSADKATRGRVFGLIVLTMPLGALLGGITSGPIVDRWGFPALFTLAALLAVFMPLVALLVKEVTVQPVQQNEVETYVPGFITHTPFLLVFCASILVHVANSEIVLGRPLIMDALKFDATAISSTIAVGGALGIPLPFLTGWISDRFGRKPLLVFCYLTTMVGLVVLMSAQTIWDFWVVSALQLMLSGSVSVGYALVTDWFPQKSLGTPLALFSASPSIGFVVGFGVTGMAMDVIGTTATLMIGVGLTLIAAVLVLPIDRQARPQPAVT